MEVDQDLQYALASPEPVMALRDMLIQRMSAGRSRESLVDEFTQIMLKFRELGMVREEELLLDGLDILVGWVSPQMKIQEPD